VDDGLGCDDDADGSARVERVRVPGQARDEWRQKHLRKATAVGWKVEQLEAVAGGQCVRREVPHDQRAAKRQIPGDRTPGDVIGQRRLADFKAIRAAVSEREVVDEIEPTDAVGAGSERCTAAEDKVAVDGAISKNCFPARERKWGTGLK